MPRIAARLECRAEVYAPHCGTTYSFCAIPSSTPILASPVPVPTASGRRRVRTWIPSMEVSSTFAHLTSLLLDHIDAVLTHPVFPSRSGTLAALLYPCE
eukprot:scaffold70631_cov55-Phaeocystis_antarctica.AAC.3